MRNIRWPVLLCALLSARPAFAQNECPPFGQRVFRLYDVTVQIPRPESEEAVDTMRWRRLFRFSTGYMDWFYGTNKSPCMVGLVPRPGMREINPADEPDVFDTWEQTHRAAGEPASATIDYFIYGEMQSDEGGLPRVTMNVVTGKTHIPIYRSESTIFADSDPYELGGFVLANENLLKITSNFPFYSELIDKWERKRRDEMPNSALNPRLELEVDRTELQPGDSTRIHIRLVDADSTPLKQRKIGVHWFDKYGELSGEALQQDEAGYRWATTNDDGRIELGLRAGQNHGGTNLKIEWNYERPSERLMYTSEYEPITIVGGKWNGSITLRYIDTQDLTTTGQNASEPARVDINRASTAEIITSVEDGVASSSVRGGGYRTMSWYHNGGGNCVAVGTPGIERGTYTYKGSPETELEVEQLSTGFKISVVPPVLTEQLKVVRESTRTPFCGGGHKEWTDELPINLRRISWMSQPEERVMLSGGKPLKIQVLKGKTDIFDMVGEKGGTHTTLIAEWMLTRTLSPQ